MSCRRILVAVLVAGLTFAPALGFAKDNVASLAKKLASADDFRVRTQAALALGASGDAGAVKPLCGGLGDDSDTVRAAAAAALGKLQRGGLECLKRRAKKEQSRNVKKMIAKAIRLVEEAAAGPAMSGATRVYLAVGQTTDKTGRGGGAIDEKVRSAITRIAGTLGGYVVAPAGETTEQADKRLRKHHHVLPFLLATTVHAPDYSGGRLVVRLDMQILGYPDRAPQGELSRTVGLNGVTAKSPEKEDQLIDQAIDEAMAEFAKMVAQVD